MREQKLDAVSVALVGLTEACQKGGPPPTGSVLPITNPSDHTPKITPSRSGSIAAPFGPRGSISPPKSTYHRMLAGSGSDPFATASSGTRSIPLGTGVGSLDLSAHPFDVASTAQTRSRVGAGTRRAELRSSQDMVGPQRRLAEWVGIIATHARESRLRRPAASPTGAYLPLTVFTAPHSFRAPP